MARGRALQRVRPGLVVKGVLQGKVRLRGRGFVQEASVADIYAVYSEAAKLERLKKRAGNRVHRKVMSYKSFQTFFKFARYLGFVEPGQDGTFRITELGRDAWQEWEDLKRAWQVLVKGVGTEAGKVAQCPPEEDLTTLTHKGVVWLCQEYALKRGLAPISLREADPLPGSGVPDLLLGDELGTRFYAVEVKSRGAQRVNALSGIGQCAGYKCGIPNVNPCLVIPEKLSDCLRDVCSKLSLDWIALITYSDKGELSLVYGEDSFVTLHKDS